LKTETATAFYVEGDQYPKAVTASKTDSIYRVHRYDLTGMYDFGRYCWFWGVVTNLGM
jgi:hypothetical protein